MTHENSGHYTAKHPAGTTVNPQITKVVKERLTDGSITCADAHEIARTLNVPPAQVGIAIDLQEGRIIKCQLGLFGYGQGAKKVKAAKQVEPDVQKSIRNHAVDGRLACKDAWRLAREYGMPKLAMANACESLGIRIKPCQLGAF
jgi:hypothetical protein